jgi:hypothetical protein
MIALSIPIPIVTICWIATCALVGLLAMAKGRSFVSWSVLAAIATPLAGLPLLVLPDLRAKTRPNSRSKDLPDPQPKFEFNRITGELLPPPVPTAAPSKSLPVRALKGLAFRVQDSRVAAALSSAKKTARQSVQNFATNAEIDGQISKTVRSEFPNEKTTD